jgi:dTDP-4-amino-4,6-dideoxygalactose transaminase
MQMRNIPLFRVFLPPPEALMPRLQEVLYGGQISEGEPVYQFERRFERLVGSDNVISFYSGTAALHTALLLAGVRPGDEVISTAMTAEPTNMAIRHAGAEIVWADVDKLSGNLAPESISQRITNRTTAIMVVHYGGIPARMREIRAISQQTGIPVIEDAAHALGASYGGRHIGWQSDFAMFSLQAIKHMTTVDGGMLACKKARDADQGRILRWFGIDRSRSRTTVEVANVGYKYHMNNVTATIGLVQLDHIQPVLAKYIANGEAFDRELASVPGLTSCRWDKEARPSYWFYTVLAENRDGLSRKLTEAGITNSTVHKRNDLHPVFGSSKRQLPGLDWFYGHMLHIPCGWWVGEEDCGYIMDTIRSGW